MDDPRYQPTKAEMQADISIPEATPEKLAQAIFRGGDPHASPHFPFQLQITPKTSRYTRCSSSIFPNISINGRTRSSDQLGRW